MALRKALNIRRGYDLLRNPVSENLPIASCEKLLLTSSKLPVACFPLAAGPRPSLQNIASRSRIAARHLLLQRAALLRENSQPDFFPFPDTVNPVRERCKPISLPIVDCQLPICNFVTSYFHSP